MPPARSAVHHTRFVELPLACVHADRQRTTRADVVHESSLVLVITVVPRQVARFHGVRVVANRATCDRSDTCAACSRRFCLARRVRVVLFRREAAVLYDKVEPAAAAGVRPAAPIRSLRVA